MELRVSKEGQLGFMERSEFPSKDAFFMAKVSHVDDAIHCVELTKPSAGMQKGWKYSQKGEWREELYKRI